MRNEGKIYETLLNRPASKWSKRQVNLFIHLLWNLEYRGQEMLSVVSDLGLKTPYGKIWTTTNLGQVYGKFQRAVRDTHVLANLTKTFNAIMLKKRTNDRSGRANRFTFNYRDV
jgi:hypothetical protein